VAAAALLLHCSCGSCAELVVLLGGISSCHVSAIAENIRIGVLVQCRAVSRPCQLLARGEPRVELFVRHHRGAARCWLPYGMHLLGRLPCYEQCCHAVCVCTACSLHWLGPQVLAVTTVGCRQASLTKWREARRKASQVRQEEAPLTATVAV
jgi:hypothetical protein